MNTNTEPNIINHHVWLQGALLLSKTYIVLLQRSLYIRSLLQFCAYDFKCISLSLFASTQLLYRFQTLFSGPRPPLVKTSLLLILWSSRLVLCCHLVGSTLIHSETVWLCTKCHCAQSATGLTIWPHPIPLMLTQQTVASLLPDTSSCKDRRLTWIALVALIVFRALDCIDSGLRRDQLTPSDQCFCNVPVQRAQVPPRRSPAHREHKQ